MVCFLEASFGHNLRHFLSISGNCCHKAAKCFTALLNHHLPEVVRESVHNQLELCDLHRFGQPPVAEVKALTLSEQKNKPVSEVDLQWIPETSLQGQKQKKPVRKRKAVHKKKSRKDPSKSTIPAGVSEETATIPVTEAVARSTSSPQHSAAEDIRTEPVSTQTLAGTSKKEAKAEQPPEPFLSEFHPQGGWVSDRSPSIQDLLWNVDSCREQFDFPSEQKCLERWLKKSEGQPEYGRICEEASWFYLRQLGIAGEPVMLSNDQPAPKSKLCSVATKWLCKALACYLDMPVKRNINPEELQQQIENHYYQHPERAEDPDYRKRLRSVCASFGHIHEKFAGLQSGKRNKYHSSLSHRFYKLKTVADPDYTPQVYAAYTPKVAVISAREFRESRD